MQTAFIYDCIPRLCINASRSTGKERDAESGNDYFGARYYGPGMGRFIAPDWSARSEPVPYAKLDNPQSLNLYAYVLDNPLSRKDLDGHCNTGLGSINCDRPSQLQQCICDSPKNADGSAKPPPVDPPRGADGEKNSWVQKPPSGTGGRTEAWESKFPTNRTPEGKGSKAGASWDDGDPFKGIPGHWDVSNGYGDTSRYLPDGTQVDHWGNPSNDNAGLPLSNQIGDFVSDHKGAILGAAAITGAIFLAPETGGTSLLLLGLP